MNIKKFEKYWKKQGRKSLFMWVYRYLRLHKELLEDSVYKEMFEYHRATILVYMKRDFGNEETSDEESGELLDFVTDAFNGVSAERLNAYKPLVESLYQFWKSNPEERREIRI